MKRCCVNCFADDSIREFIVDHNETGDCDYCGSSEIPIRDIATVGNFVREGLTRAYQEATTVDITDSRDEKYLRRDFATSVLEAEAGIADTARDKHLARDLLATFSADEARLDDAWLEDGDALIARPKGFFELYGVEEANTYASAWELFKSTVMHQARFFDIEAPRESLIRPISDLFLELEGILKADTPVFRARLADERLPNEPWEIQRALGPPPLRSAQHSRMSPPGISYLYASGDPDTCIAEIQPSVGREVWLARFRVLTNIKLLDFTRLPNIEIPSIFSDDYDPNLEWADSFLSAFLAEISQPPRSKDDLLEYVPTQVLAEYIRAQGYQGIAYQSAQHFEGVNYTLFCGPDNESSLHYAPDRSVFNEWLRIEEVSTVRISALELKTLTIDARIVEVVSCTASG